MWAFPPSQAPPFSNERLFSSFFFRFSRLAEATAHHIYCRANAAGMRLHRQVYPTASASSRPGYSCGGFTCKVAASAVVVFAVYHYYYYYTYLLEAKDRQLQREAHGGR
jgi:hypothetical protein